MLYAYEAFTHQKNQYAMKSNWVDLFYCNVSFKFKTDSGDIRIKCFSLVTRLYFLVMSQKKLKCVIEKPKTLITHIATFYQKNLLKRMDNYYFGIFFK